MVPDKPVDQIAGDYQPTPTTSTLSNRPLMEILVVEDHDGVLQMLETVLRHYGFAVRPAGNGMQAIEIYQQHAATIGLVLLDVQIPGMLDGPATLVALRQLNPNLRGVFMSGHTGAYSHEQLLALGASFVIPKPFTSLDHFADLLWKAAMPAK